MPPDPEAIVRSYWERIWLERDLDALEELCTDPHTRHTVHGTQVFTIPELKLQVGDAIRAVRGTDLSIDAFSLDGDVAWLRLTLRGCSIATMQPMTLTWMAQYRIVDDKIAEMWALHQADLDWHE